MSVSDVPETQDLSSALALISVLKQRLVELRYRQAKKKERKKIERKRMMEASRDLFGDIPDFLNVSSIFSSSEPPTTEIEFDNSVDDIEFLNRLKHIHTSCNDLVAPVIGNLNSLSKDIPHPLSFTRNPNKEINEVDEINETNLSEQEPQDSSIWPYACISGDFAQFQNERKTNVNSELTEQTPLKDFFPGSMIEKIVEEMEFLAEERDVLLILFKRREKALLSEVANLKQQIVFERNETKTRLSALIELFGTCEKWSLKLNGHREDDSVEELNGDKSFKIFKELENINNYLKIIHQKKTKVNERNEETVKNDNQEIKNKSSVLLSKECQTMLPEISENPSNVENIIFENDNIFIRKIFSDDNSPSKPLDNRNPGNNHISEMADSKQDQILTPLTTGISVRTVKNGMSSALVSPCASPHRNFQFSYNNIRELEFNSLNASFIYNPAQNDRCQSKLSSTPTETNNKKCCCPSISPCPSSHSSSSTSPHATTCCPLPIISSSVSPNSPSDKKVQKINWINAIHATDSFIFPSPPLIPYRKIEAKSSTTLFSPSPTVTADDFGNTSHFLQRQLLIQNQHKSSTLTPLAAGALKGPLSSPLRRERFSSVINDDFSPNEHRLNEIEYSSSHGNKTHTTINNPVSTDNDAEFSNNDCKYISISVGASNEDDVHPKHFVKSPSLRNVNKIADLSRSDHSNKNPNVDILSNISHVHHSLPHINDRLSLNLSFNSQNTSSSQVIPLDIPSFTSRTAQPSLTAMIRKNLTQIKGKDSMQKTRLVELSDLSSEGASTSYVRRFSIGSSTPQKKSNYGYDDCYKPRIVKETNLNKKILDEASRVPDQNATFINQDSKISLFSKNKRLNSVKSLDLASSIGSAQTSPFQDDNCSNFCIDDNRPNVVFGDTSDISRRGSVSSFTLPLSSLFKNS